MNTSQPCHPRLLSMVPSSRCQVRLTVCERSATQKCINLPNSFFRSPQVRDTRRIVEGQIIHAARSFYIPAAVHGHPSPCGDFWGSMSHIVLALFHLFQMIARQAGHGHGTRIASRKRHGTRRKRQFGDIFLNYLISIVHPHSESRFVPMNRLAENMSWWNTIDSIPFE